MDEASIRAEKGTHSGLWGLNLGEEWRKGDGSLLGHSEAPSETVQEEKGGAPQEKVERGLEEVTGRGRAGARLLCWETQLQQNL